MTRINKSDAAKIAGMHEKTLERRFTDQEFRDRTGYHKDPVNGRVTFDEQKLRTYVAEIRGDDAIRQTGANSDTHENVIDAQIVNKETAMVKAVGNRSVAEPVNFNGGPAALVHALLVPHKLFLTLDEAKLLTGFPKTELHRISKIICGRRVIKRSDLDKARFKTT